MKLTTEQKTILIDTCNAMINREATSDYSANLREVAKIALSVLTTETVQPVAWRHDDGPFAGMALTRSQSVADSWIANGWTVTPLFPAPPAPANARAVAWEMRYWNSGYNMWGDWERITEKQHAEMSVRHAADNDYEFRVLYDAPPVPQSNAADWGIDESTGTQILVYKNCSVIESEQAHYVLSLINSAAMPAPAVLTQPVSSGYKLPDGGK